MDKLFIINNALKTIHGDFNHSLIHILAQLCFQISIECTLSVYQIKAKKKETKK